MKNPKTRRLAVYFIVLLALTAFFIVSVWKGSGYVTGSAVAGMETNSGMIVIAVVLLTIGAGAGYALFRNYLNKGKEKKHTLEEGVLLCPKCGTEVGKEDMTCPKCGSRI